MIITGSPPRADDAAQLSLPELDDSGLPGRGIVSRAVTLTLATVCVLLAIGMAVAVAVPINLTADAVGSLAPTHVEPVRAAQDGVVREVLVSTGDSVGAGGALLRLDAQPPQGMSKLPTENALARGLMPTRRSDDYARDARPGLARPSRSAVDENGRAADQMPQIVATAPIAGMVLTSGLDRLPGTLVRAGDVLMEIADRREWHVELLATEQAAYEIRPGDPVRLRIPALGGDQDDFLAARVESVSPEPVSVAPGSSPLPGMPRAYRVLANLEPAQLARFGVDRIRLGYTVEGHVVTQSGTIARILWKRMWSAFRWRF